jgi:putative resolvase
MKLSAWAEANGLTYQTAWRMWRNGKRPVPAEQLPTGTVIVHPPKTPTVDSVAIYARVSSADQKADLERQLGRLAEFASRERLMVVRSVSEIGCGLNGHCAKIMRLLSDPAVQTIVVEIAIGSPVLVRSTSRRPSQRAGASSLSSTKPK